MPTESQLAIYRKINRYEKLRHKAYQELAVALEKEATAIQECVARLGMAEEWNTYLLRLILDQLDAINDLDGIGQQGSSPKRLTIGALLCASAEDLLALRQAHNMPAYTKEEDLASENTYYRRNSLWAKQENARYERERAKRNAKPRPMVQPRVQV